VTTPEETSNSFELKSEGKDKRKSERTTTEGTF